ncbi:MAG: hypothetical protein ABI610_08835 [Acidobacteriota bacterium]
MTLAPGTRLRPYETLAPLGEVSELMEKLRVECAGYRRLYEDLSGP